MKKIISLILVVCMALSLVAVLVGCGGSAKNAWQEYLGAKGWSVPKVCLALYNLQSLTATIGWVQCSEHGQAITA